VSAVKTRQVEITGKNWNQHLVCFMLLISFMLVADYIDIVIDWWPPFKQKLFEKKEKKIVIRERIPIGVYFNWYLSGKNKHF